MFIADKTQVHIIPRKFIIDSTEIIINKIN